MRLLLPVIIALSLSVLGPFALAELQLSSSCFEGEGGYYNFGNGLAFTNFQTEKTTYSPGDTIEIDYVLTGNQQAPIVEGFTRVQVIYTHPEQKEILVDEFFGEEQKGMIYLMAGDEMRKEIRWKVPEGAPAGEYTVKLYFLAGDAFNLAGLSFVPYGPPGVPAIFTTFAVSSSAKESHIYYNKMKTTLNGNAYDFSNFAPVIAPSDGISVITELANVGEQKTAKATMNLYRWDDVEGKPLQEYSITRDVNLAAGGKQALTFDTNKDLEPGTYELVFTAASGEEKSVMKMRISVAGERLRMNYAGIADFPLMAGKESKLFVCMGNSADSFNLAEGRVEIEFKDKDGKTVVKESSALADFPPQPTGLEAVFTPSETVSKGTLIATAYDGAGNVADKVDMDYDYSRFAAVPAKLDIAPGKATFSSGEKIMYTVIFTDERGIGLEGKVLVYLLDSGGKVIRIAEDVAVSGTYAGEFEGVDEQGDYRLVVREKERDLSDETSVMIAEASPAGGQEAAAPAPGAGSVPIVAALLIIVIVAAFVLIRRKKTG